MEKKTFYITTPIFYPNAKLHMGHAYTITLCDILTRAHKLLGEETYFLTGSDENTGKILKTIEETGESVEEYLSRVADGFKDLYSRLNISYDQFIQTSDKAVHWPGAVALWNTLVETGDIYKGTYSGLYCTGCETFYTEKELVDGKCPVHLTEPQHIEEENYFFRLSKYNEQLKTLIERDTLRITPVARKNEILALISRGLEDVSFSRPKSVVPHGIPVPGDEQQVIYVWCDALVNYISALGYGRDEQLFKKFWPANVQVIGKDILRFHAALWPAMLMSAGIAPEQSLLVHGLITSGGHKMSKSLGNVIDPYELLDEYGADAVRYFLAREIPTFEDGDLTRDRFKESYNAHLANGVGNLTSRIMKMAHDNLDAPVTVTRGDMSEYLALYEKLDINKAAEYVWAEVKAMDQYIQDNAPFKVVKTDKEAGQKMISELVTRLYMVAEKLSPIMPETSEKIKILIKENTTPVTPLFVRKD